MGEVHLLVMNQSVPGVIFSQSGAGKYASVLISPCLGIPGLSSPEQPRPCRTGAPVTSSQGSGPKDSRANFKRLFLASDETM